MKLVASVLMFTLLSGCMTMEDRCQSYGFVKGSVSFSQCLMQLDLARRAPDTMVCTKTFGTTTCNAY